MGIVQHGTRSHGECKQVYCAVFIHQGIMQSSNTLEWQFVTILLFGELVANLYEFVKSHL